MDVGAAREGRGSDDAEETEDVIPEDVCMDGVDA